VANTEDPIGNANGVLAGKLANFLLDSSESTC
jgi:hypothetical protein